MSVTSNSVNKITYREHDSRLNVHELDNRLAYQDADLREAVKKQAKSIACMIHESQFDIDPLTKVHRLATVTLTDFIQNLRDDKGNLEYGYPLAADERFRNELAPGFGTAFLVSKNTVLTAAHCVCKDDSDALDPELIGATRFIFNFTTFANSRCRTEYNENEIYKIKKVKAHRFIDKKIDWAWVKLDRDVVGAEPLQLYFSPIDTNRKVYMIGHPEGQPTKLSPIATVKTVGDFYKKYITADLDSFKGNSGSPIFDRITKKVIALLFHGLGPGYKICYDYEGPGHHRVKTRQATSEDIAEHGYEKCYPMREIKVHLGQRISWIAQQEMKAGKAKSDQKSLEYKNKIMDRLELKEKLITQSVIMIFVPITTIPGLVLRNQYIDEMRKLRDKLSKYERIQEQFRNVAEINLLEAKFISKLERTTPSSIKARLARNACAYGLNISDALNLLEMEDHFQDRFPPESILKLIQYETNRGNTFSNSTRERILTYMHNDYENSERSVPKAYLMVLTKLSEH